MLIQNNFGKGFGFVSGSWGLPSICGSSRGVECRPDTSPLAWHVCPGMCLFRKRWVSLDLACIRQVLQHRKKTLLCRGLMCPLVTGFFMDKVSSKKLCADDNCVSNFVVIW